MIYTFTTIGVIVVVFYTHMAFRGLYTFLGAKRPLHRVPKWRWATFLIPLVFLVLGIPTIGIWNERPAVMINIITISTFLSVVFEFLRWRFTKPGMDTTIEERFRAEFPEIEVLDPETLDLGEHDRAFLERALEKPHEFSMTVLRCFGLTLEMVVMAYQDFLDSIGHAEVEWREKAKFQEIASRMPEPTYFFLTVTNYQVGSLHCVSYDEKTGLITIMSNLKQIRMSAE